MGTGEFISALQACAQKSFSLPESVLDKSKTCFRRLQNSPAAQTLVTTYLTLRQALLAKTLSMTAQMDIFWATPVNNCNYKEDTEPSYIESTTMMEKTDGS